MPVCVHCAHPARHVYTTYKTKSNIRLSICERCDQFVDPLIEHPPLIILLDLVLLKPRVYLHLLYNRGTTPHDAESPNVVAEAQEVAKRKTARTQLLRRDLVRLAAIAAAAETAMRIPKTDSFKLNDLLVAAMGAVIELGTQHLVTLCLALAFLRIQGWYPARQSDPKQRQDGRQRDFIPIIIPLTLLYTSILPLLLQLVLSIWYHPSHTHHEDLPSISDLPILDLLPRAIGNILPTGLRATLGSAQSDMRSLWHNSDRIWAGTRLLGGMSSGFGLRVVLPTQPWGTTMLVLAGWLAGSLITGLAVSSAA